MLRNTDGALTTTIPEGKKRWTEWITKCFQSTHKQEEIDIQHITEEQWEQTKQQRHETTQLEQPNAKLTYIRNKSTIQQLFLQHPHVNEWLTRPYSNHEIKATISQLQNNKATGADGIPGEIYKNYANTLKSSSVQS